jgi:hypothetical protein
LTRHRAVQEEADAPVPAQDKATLRNELVPAMIALSSPQDKGSRAQVAETVSLIAQQDFPAQWPNLIDVSTWLCAIDLVMIAPHLSTQLF